MARAERRRRLWQGTRLHLVFLFILLALAVTGVLLIRVALLENAYETGTALSRTYASEESGSLAMYETLLSFGTATVDQLAAEGRDREELLRWLDIYFQRLAQVLGDHVVDPYLVVDGEILAAHPWPGDAAYDAAGTPWYQQAAAAPGEVVFTDIYMDVISGEPVITAAQMGQSGAVMAFDIFPEHLQFGSASTDLAEGNSFFLCDRAGTIIYQETDLDVSEEVMQRYLHDLIVRIEAGELDRYNARVVDLDGQNRAVYYTRMDNGWYSIVTVPYRNILDSFDWFTFSFSLVIVLSLLAVAWMTWRGLELNVRMERSNETVQVLGNTYYALYRVDFEQETYEMIKGSDYVRQRIPSSGPYEELLRVAGEVIEADAYRDFTTSLSCENIRELVRQQVRDFGGDFLRRFGEEYRWVSVRVLFDDSLLPEEVVLSFREVEQEKQRQLREHKLLRDSLELARRNEASKQRFFSNMSHDMRTPLNAIINLTALAQQNLDDRPRLKDYLQKILSSSRYLLELINDILDMSRMEQGKVTLDERVFDLRTCLDECLETFRIRAEAAGKTFSTDLRLLDTPLLGDPFRIQQILNNLLSNALKFTSAGGSISVAVEAVEQGDIIQYKFVVADTGIGMSPEFQAHLFEPYAREMRFSAHQAAGTGLGMSITKSLVSLMNGEIHVDSQPGQGSTFTVILPFPAARQESPAPQAGDDAAFSLDGLRLLVAEDNEINMEILTELLSAQGVQVTQAWNGAEAVERFQEAAPGSFDAVLMDMQMPEMDGCEAARRIRALDRPDAGSIPILAVTANAFSEDIAATAAAGMNGHISKPIDPALLRRTLAQMLQRPGQTADASGGSAS